MLLIMVVQFFASFGEGTKQIEMVVSLIQIATTCMSILSAYVSLKWNEENVKGIDVRQVQAIVTSRQKKVKPLKKSPNSKSSNRDRQESSSDTDNSQRNQFANVHLELEMFTSA